MVGDLLRGRLRAIKEMLNRTICSEEITQVHAWCPNVTGEKTDNDDWNSSINLQQHQNNTLTPTRLTPKGLSWESYAESLTPKVLRQKSYAKSLTPTVLHQKYYAESLTPKVLRRKSYAKSQNCYVTVLRQLSYAESLTPEVLRYRLTSTALQLTILHIWPYVVIAITSNRHGK